MQRSQDNDSKMAAKKKKTSKKSQKKTSRDPRRKVKRTKEEIEADPRDTRARALSARVDPDGNCQAKFAPTREQRIQVELLAGVGLSQGEIACVIINPATNEGIAKNTLRQHFKAELERGAASVKGKVLGNLAKHAMGNGKGAVTAAIFIAKTRYGWKETQVVEHKGSGVLVAPASITPERWIAQEQERDRLHPGEASRN